MGKSEGGGTAAKHAPACKWRSHDRAVRQVRRRACNN
jgi:hypothetical protein